MDIVEVSLLDRLNSPAMYGIVALAIVLVLVWAWISFRRGGGGR